MKDSILEMTLDERLNLFLNLYKTLKNMVIKGSKGELEVLIHKIS